MQELFMVKVVKNTRLDNSTLQISNEVSDKLGLDGDEAIELRAGGSSARLQLSRTEKSGRVLELNPGVINKLHLMTTMPLGIMNNNQIIHLGPVVGVMAENCTDMNRPFRGQSNFIKQLIKNGNELGEICFGFSPFSINFQNKYISGYSLVNGSWKKGIFPIPDVVYPRHGGYVTSTIRIRNKLEDMGCKFINPPLIGKWLTYQTLIKNIPLQQYIPDTVKVNKFQQVEQMLLKHGAVYLKPITGSQGRNIIKVVRVGNSSTYKYYYQVKYQSREGTANSLDSLRRNINRLMNGRKYIVQRKIDLLQIDGRIADIRVMVQKDNTGQWSVTGEAFRIGKMGSITSNISGGGQGQKMSVVLKKFFIDQQIRDGIINEINYLAVEAARELEKKTSSIGELGIDIGIDADGKLWFIEANLKPARQVFLMIGETETRKMTIVKPLLYARYLADFTE